MGHAPCYIKNIAIILCLVIVASLLVSPGILLQASSQADKPLAAGIDAGSSGRATYEYYLADYQKAPKPDRTHSIKAKDYIDGEDVTVVSDPENEQRGQEVLATGETGFAEWELDVKEAGLYQIKLDYYPLPGRGASIERALQINGEQAFFNAGHFLFHRIWRNQDHEPGDPYVMDNRGNEIRPRQTEAAFWRTVYLEDYLGYEQKPYYFYFDKGINTLRLSSIREPMLIKAITVHQQPELPTYEDVKTEYERRDYAPYEGEPIKIQGEDALYRSDATLYPINDRSSPMTEPYDPSKIRLNSVGGGRWNQPHQWITWEIEAPHDGLYQLVFKQRQNLSRGVYSSRELRVDGEVPFAEAGNLRFYFDSEWQMYVLGQGTEKEFNAKETEPQLLYLTEGKHDISLKVILGEFSEAIQTVEESLYRLNDAYRRIIMLTTTNPDIYRDYHLKRELPGVIAELGHQADVLSRTADLLYEITGERGSQTAILSTLAYQLRRMHAMPDDIPRLLPDFKTNIGALGTWILTATEKPLEIDYLLLGPPGMDLPPTRASLGQHLIHELRSFSRSFTEDYSSVGNVFEGEEEILTVWTQGGRDQAQVLKQLIDHDFTAQYGIPVNLQVVQVGTLLPATVAGIGPDVALDLGGAEPVNFASRGAAVDLSQFPGFEEVELRFAPSALVPYRYQDGVYALPVTQTFPMMFYRTDILDDLGVTVPQTWDELMATLPQIQKNHLEFGIPVATTQFPDNGMMSFYMFLYQQGGQLYRAEGSRSALDQEEAVQAFSQWTSLFLNYKLPQSYDFPNRFRVGEMPLGIADYQTYNTLQVFAPEIRGLWEMSPVPGYLNEHGEIQREVGSWGQNCIMLAESDQQEAAWTFMKWWTSADVQENFGREMESLLGAAARYPTANLEAVSRLPWPYEDYRNLMDQWEDAQGIPEVPGSYYTPRHLNNAFRRVVYNGENARETLLDYVRDINDELTSKRQEFGLPTYEEIMTGEGENHGD